MTLQALLIWDPVLLRLYQFETERMLKEWYPSANMFRKVENWAFRLDKETDQSMRIYLILTNLEGYINGAIIQISRLTRIRNKFKSIINPRVLPQAFDYLRNDTHFYFICIDKVYKLISQVALELKDKEIGQIAEDLQQYFNLVTIRNTLEHIEKRSSGYIDLNDEKAKKRSHITDFGNYVGDDFSFNGQRFPSGRKSLVYVKKSFLKIIDIIQKKYLLDK